LFSCTVPLTEVRVCTCASGTNSKRLGTRAEIIKRQLTGRLRRPEEVVAGFAVAMHPAASFVIGVGLPADGRFTGH
jgi:NAD(P)-dependent dehydrogenase (short-subunit alcohol dehydrogenase family)